MRLLKDVASLLVSSKKQKVYVAGTGELMNGSLPRID
jgi:hypothetical protein